MVLGCVERLPGAEVAVGVDGEGESFIFEFYGLYFGLVCYNFVVVLAVLCQPVC